MCARFPPRLPSGQDMERVREPKRSPRPRPGLPGSAGPCRSSRPRRISASCLLGARGATGPGSPARTAAVPWPVKNPPVARRSPGPAPETAPAAAATTDAPARARAGRPAPAGRCSAGSRRPRARKPPISVRPGTRARRPARPAVSRSRGMSAPFRPFSLNLTRGQEQSPSLRPAQRPLPAATAAQVTVTAHAGAICNAKHQSADRPGKLRKLALRPVAIYHGLTAPEDSQVLPAAARFRDPLPRGAALAKGGDGKDSEPGGYSFPVTRSHGPFRGRAFILNEPWLRAPPPVVS